MEKPAIDGGKPIRKNYLVFGKPDIGEAEINQVVKVLKSKWLGTGPMAKKFEENFSKYIGCKYSITLNSCTAALFLSLLCSGIKINDEIITTPMTFAATVNVIEHIGARPIFIDIEEDSYNIDADKIENIITSNTKAILPVHFGGLPCDMGKIQKIANKYKLHIIEDAAHAVGAEYNSKKIGSFGNPTCFSFYATKNLTTGEGGMVCLNDKDLAEKIKIFSLHGLSKNAWQRFDKNSKKIYDILYPGYKYNMADINAAIGIKQLERINEMNSLRRKFAKIYLESFENIDLIEIPSVKSGRKSSWHLFPILLKIEKLRISRNQFIIALDRENIGSGCHYQAIHSQKYYKDKYNYKINDFKRAAYVSERTLSIPLQSSMNEVDVMDVIKAVKKLLNYYKK
ncbi:MAG: DegT/DnrJ/EryC1/StrS family aminotransferase [Promethearchaeota archaeon]